MINWTNGNANISLDSDGTRVIEYPDNETLKLEYPLNVDIRISNRCAFGMSPNGNAVCTFCHESARTDGIDCNFDDLLYKLNTLPAGVELAIGFNQFDHYESICYFLRVCKSKGWVVNATVNQGHLHRDRFLIKDLVNEGLIKGLGISYRSGMKDAPSGILDYNNSVWHVIAGIDAIDEIIALADKGVQKILVLGEKNFGFNLGKVDLSTEKHFWWFRRVHELFNKFRVVSFDNLALEQLKIKRFFTEDRWSELYQGEHSFYINAVNGYYSRSSRDIQTVDWNSCTAIEFFQRNCK